MNDSIIQMGRSLQASGITMSSGLAAASRVAMEAEKAKAIAQARITADQSVAEEMSQYIAGERTNPFLSRPGDFEGETLNEKAEAATEEAKTEDMDKTNSQWSAIKDGINNSENGQELADGLVSDVEANYGKEAADAVRNFLDDPTDISFTDVLGRMPETFTDMVTADDGTFSISEGLKMAGAFFASTFGTLVGIGKKAYSELKDEAAEAWGDNPDNPASANYRGSNLGALRQAEKTLYGREPDIRDTMTPGYSLGLTTEEYSAIDKEAKAAGYSFDDYVDLDPSMRDAALNLTHEGIKARDALNKAREAKANQTQNVDTDSNLNPTDQNALANMKAAEQSMNETTGNGQNTSNETGAWGGDVSGMEGLY
jgi:hypothetical protein